LTASKSTSGLLRVGEPVRASIDLAEYQAEATLTGPRQLRAAVQATPPENAAGSSGGTTWDIHYPATSARGFYELRLSRREGGVDTRLFAANIDPAEGNLKRVDRAQLARELAAANIRVLSAAEAPSLDDAGSQTEIWWYLLWALVAVLYGEQLLGWFFGRRRS
jgi:hypothetical protein